MNQKKYEGLVIMIKDYGRMNQRSFNISEIYNLIDTKKYKQVKHVVLNFEHNDNQQKEIEKKAKQLKWKTTILELTA